jgi:hypothetical protein
MATAETAEEISKKPEVPLALSQTRGPKTGTEKVKAATKDKFWFVTHALLIVGCAVLYYFVGSKLIPVPQNTVDLSRRFLRGAALIVIVLAIAKAIPFTQSDVSMMPPPASPCVESNTCSSFWSSPSLLSASFSLIGTLPSFPSA